MRSPNTRLLPILMLIALLGASCSAGQALTSGQAATAEEAQVAGETASSLQSQPSEAAADPAEQTGGQSIEPDESGTDTEAASDPGSEVTTAPEDFAGGELQLPRSFRYGLIDVEIVDAQLVGGQSQISLRLSNSHEENVSNVTAGLFRILEGDRTWTKLEYADDQYSVDIEPRGVTEVVLVGEQVELTTSALQINASDTVPMIVPFGGAYEASAGREVVAGQVATNAVYDCGTDGNVSMKISVNRATIVLDIDVARSGYTANHGRAEEGQSFLRVEASFEQLTRCDRALDIAESDIEIDGNSDFDVEMNKTKLLENGAVDTVILFSYPVGADNVTFTIGEGESIVIPVS